MKTNLFLGVLTLSLLLFWGCSSSNEELDEKAFLPSSSGAGHEILVVSDYAVFDSSSIGKAINNYFEDEFRGISTSEKNFNIIEIKTKDFNSLLQRHGKILLINDNDASFAQPKLDIRQDVWAKNQLMIKINAKSTQEAIQLFEEKKSELMSMYHEWDMRNLALNFWRHTKKTTQDHLSTKFGIKLAIPDKYDMAFKADDFTWYRYDTDKSVQGIMVYKESYTADSTFTKDYIVNRRNKMAEKYIPGTLEDSYMVVDSVFPVRQFAINLDGCYAMESKGIWGMNNGFMGGAFVSYTVYNKNKEEIITIDGFVHAPNQEKKYMLLEVEAILKSMLLQ